MEREWLRLRNEAERNIVLAKKASKIGGKVARRAHTAARKTGLAAKEFAAELLAELTRRGLDAEEYIRVLGMREWL
jgi:hypothetical protein